MTTPEQIFDDARRMADHYNGKLLENRQAHKGRWMAFRLADGSSDDTLYDTYKDARRHNEDRPCVVLQLAPDGIKPRAAAAILKFHRGLYDAGIRLGDPQPEMGLEQQRVRSQFDAPPKGLILP